MSRETKKKKGTEKEQFLLLDGHDVAEMTVDFGSETCGILIL